MPTYDYECSSCGHIFELRQSIAAEPVKTCEKCKGEVKRHIGSGTGIIFKGTGFYETDYKRSRSGKKPCEGGGGDCSACGVNK